MVTQPMIDEQSEFWSKVAQNPEARRNADNHASGSGGANRSRSPAMFRARDVPRSRRLSDEAAETIRKKHAYRTAALRPAPRIRLRNAQHRNGEGRVTPFQYPSRLRQGSQTLDTPVASDAGAIRWRPLVVILERRASRSPEPGEGEESRTQLLRVISPARSGS
jgi:hypothetical protein